MRALQAGADQLEAVRFDRSRGVRTTGIVELDDLEVVGPNRHHGVWYEGAAIRTVRAGLAAIPEPAQRGFVDLGCGRGRVLRLALEAGIGRVSGVEFSPTLADAARENTAGLGVEVTVSDAAAHRFEPEDDVVFLFNPFDGVVLTAALDAFAESLREHPRPSWLLYLAPAHAWVVERHGFVEAQRWSRGADDLVLYRRR